MCICFQKTSTSSTAFPFGGYRESIAILCTIQNCFCCFTYPIGSLDGETPHKSARSVFVFDKLCHFDVLSKFVIALHFNAFEILLRHLKHELLY